ncbi:hypothetical protein H0H87_009372, partial [Tephrocybe sp. NHM501043]
KATTVTNAPPTKKVASNNAMAFHIRGHAVLSLRLDHDLASMKSILEDPMRPPIAKGLALTIMLAPSRQAQTKEICHVFRLARHVPLQHPDADLRAILEIHSSGHYLLDAGLTNKAVAQNYSIGLVVTENHSATDMLKWHA